MYNKTKTNKLINGESINYTLVYVVCALVFFAVKQIFKIAIGINADIATGISFGISAVLLYIFERSFVFTNKVKSSNIIQILGMVFRSLVNVGFYLICKFFMCNVLKLEASVAFFITILILYYFDYYFDRLVVFNCTNNPANNKNGRVYTLFYNNRFVVLSGLVAALSFIFIYIVLDMFPMGDTTVMRMDLYHQYGPMMTELYDRVLNGKSFLYSWQTGGGSSFLGNYLNYLASPISAIIFLFDRKDIDFAITTLVLVKGILSACTFTYYLKKSLNSHCFSSAAFGVLYAFCGYFLAYYWNIMWIDGMILLPLIALGIENIINNGKPILYIGSLTLLLFSNYYMGYMTCIFAVLYFLVYFVVSGIPGKLDPNQDKKAKWYSKVLNYSFLNRGIIFAFASLLCGILCACTLIPTFTILQGSSATSGSFPTTFESYFDILDLLKSHIAGLETTIRSSGDDVLPNVYCGILTVLLVPLYFMNKDIRLKEKAVYLLLLIFFIFSFDNNALNYIWHAMHFPNDLPYRFSYMYSFILLIIAFKGLRRIRSLRYQDIVVIGMMWVFILLLFQKEPTNKISEKSIYMTIIFAVIWTGILVIAQSKKLSNFVVGISIVALVFSEVIISDSFQIQGHVEHSTYNINYDKYRESSDYIHSKDNGFYRSELCYLDTRNDPCIYGYDGISVFSSMAYESYSQNQYSLGMMGNRINSYTYNTQTPVYNLMYGIKYLTWTGDSIVPSSDYYSKIYTTNDGSAEVYENLYSMPIAFLTPNDIKDWDNEEGNPFEVQEDFIDKAAGVSNIFIPAKYGDTECYEATCEQVKENGTYFVSKSDVDSTTGSIDITVESVADGELYVYLSSTEIENINYYWNDNEDTHYQNASEPYIMNLGQHKKGDLVTVSLDLSGMEATEGSFDIYAYNIDKGVFASAFDMLQSCSLDITEHSDTYLKGSIDAAYDGYLYSSIPYDDSWSIYIDGKKQKTFDIGDSQLATTIKKGKHTVEYKYFPQGLKLGIIITIFGYIGVGAYLIINKKRQKKNSPNQIC